MYSGSKIFALWVGLGIVIGAVLGVLVFAFTSEVWFVITGVGFGLLFGAVYGVYRKNQYRQKALSS